MANYFEQHKDIAAEDRGQNSSMNTENNTESGIFRIRRWREEKEIKYDFRVWY